MHYKFVDIGCSFWGVSTDEFGTGVTGLLVEPIKEFIDALPDSDTITKATVAIGEKYQSVDLNVYVPNNPEIIKYYTSQYLESIYKDWLKNPTDVKWYDFIQSHPVLGPVIGCGGTSILNRTDIPLTYHTIQKKTVQMITLHQLVEQYNITQVDHLKIDVEGCEETILDQLVMLMRSGKLLVTETIRYECNFLSDESRLISLGKKIAKEFDFSYNLIKQGWNEDVWLRRVG